MAKWPVAFGAIAALVLGFGYWHASQYAYVHLRVDDHALRSPTQLYGAPHNVRLILRDRSGKALAVARSAEPETYLLAVHPDAAIGTCLQFSGDAYVECYKRYSAWLALWAPHVSGADVGVGACELRGVPVSLRRSNEAWLLWWVPLPHVGGLPKQYFDISIAVDSRACAAVKM